MTGSGFGSGALPFENYSHRALDIPTQALMDAPLYTVTINRYWFAILAGAAYVLTLDSTWLAPDKPSLRAITAMADQLVAKLANPDVAINLVFRNNPTHPQNLDFSVDGGTSWNLTADTAVHITPEFLADSAAPGGYDLTVNQGYTQTEIPLLTAVDPDAVVTDPVSSLVNQILPGTDISALKLAAQGNATPLQLVNGGIALGNLLLLVAAL